MKVVVVGLGVMGLPTVRALADRGHDVIGIDRHGISAPAGSSAGATRIFRLAHDRPGDIVLARKSLERWRALEAGSGEQLLDHARCAITAKQGVLQGLLTYLIVGGRR